MREVLVPNFRLLPSERSDERADLARALREALGELATAKPEERPNWLFLQQFGVCGFAVPEHLGGVGAELADFEALHSELGRVLGGSGLASQHAAAVLLSAESRPQDLAGLCEGRVRWATLLHDAAHDVKMVEVEGTGPGEVHCTGTIEVFPDAEGSDGLLFRIAAGDDDAWYEVQTDEARVVGLSVLDPTRPAARIHLDRTIARRLDIPDMPAVTDKARRLVAYVTAVEQLAGATRCLELAVEHANAREQFGRPIGSFQAVKHRCAAAAVRVESAAAALWVVLRDALDAPMLPAAQRLANTAHEQGSADLIHILGGLGFTWEHEAHLYYRRAVSASGLAPLLALTSRQDTASASGELIDPNAARGAENEEFADRVRSWFENNGTPASALSAPERRMDEARIAKARAHHKKLAEAGLAGIDWPTEYDGLGLGPREVRDFVVASDGYDTYADVTPISLGIVARLLIEFGTDEQRRTYLPGLRTLDTLWCQLFSEPGFGSDLAGVQTRARRDGDGFIVDGQKVWTTNAHVAEFGILLARTDPDRAKHHGLTMFILDMHAPGVDVRPITQITGEHEFCEVFLDSVKIPAGDVIGDVDGGWAQALATLRYERITLGSGTYKEVADASAGMLSRLDEVTADSGRSAAPIEMRSELSSIRLSELALDAFTQRIAEIVARGEDPGPAVSISKLLTAAAAKASAAAALKIAGPKALAWDDSPDADEFAYRYLYAPSTSIAGGTDEIQRNIIAEAILGMPREPRVSK